MDAIALGPLVLSFERFTAFVSLAVLVVVAEWLARKTDKRLGIWAGNIVLIGLLGARLGFVLLHLGFYLKAPQTIVYFWQGGFSVMSGILAGVVYSTWFFCDDFKQLRWVITPVLAGLVVWLGLLGFSTSRTPIVTELPTMMVQTHEAERIDLASFKGKPVVLNIWATWCGPCQRELPMLAKAEAEHKDVAFVFIDQRESAAKVSRYIKEKGLKLGHSLLDLSGEAEVIFRVKGTPTTMFFDSDGKLVKRHVGEISRAALEDELQRLH